MAARSSFLPSLRRRVSTTSAAVTQAVGDHAQVPKTPRRRYAYVLLCVGLFVALVAGEAPQRVGDGSEYILMAHSIAHAADVTYTPQETADAQKYLATIPGGYDVPLNVGTLNRPDGSMQLPHFWFYSALAAPPTRIFV